MFNFFGLFDFFCFPEFCEVVIGDYRSLFVLLHFVKQTEGFEFYPAFARKDVSLRVVL